MNAGTSQQRVQSRAMSIGRAVVAAILALSFLAVLVPLSNASTGSSGLRACCIGKAGHESGSCSTGLIESGGRTRVLGVSPPKAQSKSFANVKGGAGAGEHCSLHASTGAENSIAKAPIPEPPSTPEDVAEPTKPSETEESETASTSHASDSLSVHAVGSTCPGECGTCSVNYTRRPRPREHSTLSSTTRPRSTSLVRFFVSDHQPVGALNLEFSLLHPRPPPTFIA